MKKILFLIGFFCGCFESNFVSFYSVLDEHVFIEEIRIDDQISSEEVQSLQTQPIVAQLASSLQGFGTLWVKAQGLSQLFLGMRAANWHLQSTHYDAKKIYYVHLKSWFQLFSKDPPEQNWKELLSYLRAKDPEAFWILPYGGFKIFEPHFILFVPDTYPFYLPIDIDLTRLSI